MFKKILSLVLVAVWVSTTLITTSSAASMWKITFDLETADDKHEVVLVAGQTVDVYFSIKRKDTDDIYIPGAFEARILYDNSFVECIDSQKLLDGGAFVSSEKIATGEACFVTRYNYMFDFNGSEFYTSDMDFFKLTLKVKEGTSGISYIKFDDDPADTLLSFQDIDLEKVSLNYNNFKIIVGEQTTVTFDVNGTTTEVDTYTGMTLGEVLPDSISIPAGYKLDYWTLDGNMVDDSYCITGDETFTAKLVPDYSVEVYSDYITGYYLVLINGSANGYELALPSGNCVAFATPHYNVNSGDNYRAYVISNKTLANDNIIASESDEFTKEIAQNIIAISDTVSASAEVDIAGIDGYYDEAVDIFDATAVQGVLEVSPDITDRGDFVKFVLKADVDVSKRISTNDVTTIIEHDDFVHAPRK